MGEPVWVRFVDGRAGRGRRSRESEERCKGKGISS